MGWILINSDNYEREPQLRDSLASYQITEDQKNDQERKVKGREADDICSRFAGIVRDVLAEGNETCERGDQRAGAADVDTE